MKKKVVSTPVNKLGLLITKYAAKIPNIARTTSGQGKLSADSTHGDNYTPDEIEYLKYVCKNGKGYKLHAAKFHRDSTVGPWAKAAHIGLKMSKVKKALTPSEAKLVADFDAKLIARKVKALRDGKTHPNLWNNGQ